MSLRARTKIDVKPLAAKVPEVTVLFWIIKVLTTGVGESASDFLGQKSVPLAGAIGVFGFIYALRLQLRTTQYRAPVYWFAVLMVAVFGTMAADGVHDGASVPYSVTTAFYALVVAAIFFFWRRSEGTVDIHTITTRRRERYYWGAVLATFALGTAAGDLTAIQLNMGFLESAVFFGIVILAPLVAWGGFGLNAVVGFWSAYVVTRPLGASFADWFGKPHLQTGLGWGDGTVTALGLLLFVVLVAYKAVVLPHPARAVEPQPSEA